MARKIFGIIIFFLGIVFLFGCGGYSEGDDAQSAPSGSDSDFQVNFATAVNTKITLAPPNPSDSSTATFKFKCNKKSCAYKCQLDGGVWGSCKSPKTYSGLADGSHNFKVKAKDKATGKWDKTPASYSWTIDTGGGGGGGGGGSADLKQISAGENHACGVAADNTLWCWGLNDRGQIGNNSTTNVSVATQENSKATNWQQVTTGGKHTCAVKTNGTLWCWGLGNSGQLGIGSSPFMQITPIQVGSATDWKQVSAGENYTCAVKTNGTLYCWGANSYGQLGDGTNTGKNIPTQVGTDINWSQVAGNRYHTCAVKTNGTLYCWGDNTNSKLGLGSGASSSYNTPQQVGTDTNWAQVGGGPRTEYHTCAVKTTGELYCWGYDYYGQLGFGTNPNYYYTPTKVGTDTDWQQVADGNEHTCAVKTDGRLFCWGYNFLGEVGDGTLLKRKTPVQVGSDTTWTQVATGYYLSCGAKSSNKGFCWGYNRYGQLGNGTVGDKNTPHQIDAGTSWSQVSTGQTHTCATKADNTLFCFGSNSADIGPGALGDGTTISKQTPNQVPGTNWVQVSAMRGIGVGDDVHSCAVKTNNTLFCWGGYNIYGQIGDGTFGGISTVRTTPTQVGSDTDWAQVSVGGFYSMARKTNNTLWFWGRNYYGQLGDGSTATQKLANPTQVGTDTDWALLSAGDGHVCAVKTNNTLFCWGWASSGQVGDGTTVKASKAPTQVGTDIDWSSSYGALSAGYQHTCAIKKNGSLWCWGSNLYGQLGIGTYDQLKTSPTQVGTDTDWYMVSAGTYHTCAIKTNNSLYCWGGNSEGRCGDGTTNDLRSPTREITSAIDWVEVSAGMYHTCAIKNTGTLFCWGRNDVGQLGDGEAWSDSPVQVTQ